MMMRRTHAGSNRRCRRVTAPHLSTKDTMKSSSSMVRSASMPVYCRKSSMRVPTIDESLHSQYGSKPRRKSSEDSPEGLSVSFHKLQIREYARAVGDNPSCSSGAPIGLGWEYNQLDLVSVEKYETDRPPRRAHHEMAIPRSVRHEMLTEDWGATRPMLASAIRENIKIKNRRRRTVNNLGKMTRVEELCESAKRKVKRTLLRQKKPSVQYEIWMEEARRAQEAIQAENAAWHLQQQHTQETNDDNDDDNDSDDFTISSQLTTDTELDARAKEKEQERATATSQSALEHKPHHPPPPTPPHPNQVFSEADRAGSASSKSSTRSSSAGEEGSSSYLPDPLSTSSGSGSKKHHHPIITCQESDGDDDAIEAFANGTPAVPAA